ncbi:DUF4126 domain-containing protein [Pseudorhodoferax sp. Leaf267]|uniref:DUF4126 domain-containing protein n=1 Tax=Pseudorhodoferax sp. Leaf267 TaxID=1736316 RepID=UPI000700FA1D|nr:DUF4126 domain-containing protein [Pseudorhodoferax sp. Leaf267]KQP14231.1 hypothetical protein ASF43_15520 [Pseudorhodoferax sp. Leaf267]
MDILTQWWNALAAWLGVAAGHAGSVVQGSSLDLPQLLALAAVLGWASGIRLYAVLFITGMAGWLGWLPLPQGLHLLQNPAMLGASGFMLFVEFFADKIPGLDSLWDLLHSVIRIPAGAALAAGVFGADNGTMAAVAALLGGSLAATSFATKATTRAAANTSPEPFSNIGLSLLEDGLVVGAIWLATNHPVAFGICLVITLVLSVLLMVVLFKFLRLLGRKLAGLFSGQAASQGT